MSSTDTPAAGSRPCCPSERGRRPADATHPHAPAAHHPSTDRPRRARSPALLVLSLDRTGGELLLDCHPLEVLVVIVVRDALVELLRARCLDDLRRHERFVGAAVAAKALDERHRVCDEAECGQQSRRGRFTRDFPRRPSRRATQFLARIEHAVEFRCGASEVAEPEPALDDRRRRRVRPEVGPRNRSRRRPPHMRTRDGIRTLANQYCPAVLVKRLGVGGGPCCCGRVIRKARALRPSSVRE